MILFRIMQLSFEFCVSDATYIEHTTTTTCFHIAQQIHTQKTFDDRFEI